MSIVRVYRMDHLRTIRRIHLSIETCIYRNVPACERFCEICNSGVIADETHCLSCLCMCPMFRELRDELYLNVKYFDPSILLAQVTSSSYCFS